MPQHGSATSSRRVTSRRARSMKGRSPTSDQMTFWDLLSATSSPALASGATPFAAPDGLTIFPFGPDPALASLSARQAVEKGLLTSGTFGRPSTISSHSVALQSSLESRLRARLSILGSTLFKMTWKAWVTPSGRSRSRLRASVLRTSATALTSWPTPDAHAGSGGRTPKDLLALQRESGTKVQFTINHAAALSGWPTPAAHEFEIKDVDRMLERREEVKAKGINGNGFGMTLGMMTVAMATWPTPVASPANGSPEAFLNRKGRTMDGAITDIGPAAQLAS